jgi:hypothetical protein
VINKYAPHKNDGTYERSRISSISPATQAALDELNGISTWAKFTEICEKQKIKREDLKTNPESRGWWRNFR